MPKVVPIVSVSIPQPLLDDVDAAIEEDGYKGRSEFLRAAMRELLMRRHDDAEGHVHGSITLTYPHEAESRVSATRHAFHDVVLSLMHSHCEPETCMDVLTVGGEAGRVKELRETFARMRDIHRSTLSIMS